MEYNRVIQRIEGMNGGDKERLLERVRPAVDRTVQSWAGFVRLIEDPDTTAEQAQKAFNEIVRLDNEHRKCSKLGEAILEGSLPSSALSDLFSDLSSVLGLLSHPSRRLKPN